MTEKGADIRMSAEKSKKKSIEKKKEKAKKQIQKRTPIIEKKSHEMDMLNGSLAIKMLYLQCRWHGSICSSFSIRLIMAVARKICGK